MRSELLYIPRLLFGLEVWVKSCKKRIEFPNTVCFLAVLSGRKFFRIPRAAIRKASLRTSELVHFLEWLGRGISRVPCKGREAKMSEKC